MQLAFYDVSKSYGSHLALQNFSATMEPGIYALLGPNGSGKTTLMNILTDNLRADTGCITFEAPGIDAQDVKKLISEYVCQPVGINDNHNCTITIKL